MKKLLIILSLISIIILFSCEKPQKYCWECETLIVSNTLFYYDNNFDGETDGTTYILIPLDNIHIMCEQTKNDAETFEKINSYTGIHSPYLTNPNKYFCESSDIPVTYITKTICKIKQ